MERCITERPEHFGPLFGYCDHQVQKLMDRRLRQYDVSPMQCRTLTYLHEAEGEVNQKQLERHLMVKPSTVNGIVDRLEEKGMVTRTASRTDGRCRILALTAQGKYGAAVKHYRAALSTGRRRKPRQQLWRVRRELEEAQIRRLPLFGRFRQWFRPKPADFGEDEADRMIGELNRSLTRAARQQKLEHRDDE